MAAKMLTMNPGIFQPLPPSCEIESIEPAQPVEHSPITINVRVYNPSNREFNGLVRFGSGIPADKARPEEKVHIEKGPGLTPMTAGLNHDSVPSRLVRLPGFAPSAKRAALVQVALLEETPEGSPTELVSVDYQVDVSARYQFSVDWFHINKQRSANQDDDNVFGICNVSYNGQQLSGCAPIGTDPLHSGIPQGEQQKSFGEQHSNATVATPFCFGPFESVPGSRGMLIGMLSLVVQGYKGSGAESAKNFFNKASEASAKGASAAIPAASAGFAMGDVLMHSLHDLMYPDCDGPVAVDGYAATSEALDEATQTTGIYTNVTAYPGVPSPVACGGDSEYTVQTTVRRLSWVDEGHVIY